MTFYNVGPEVTDDLRVVEFFAWVAVHENGGEGVCGVMTSLGFTACCSSIERVVRMFEPHVREAWTAVQRDGASAPVRIELRRFGDQRTAPHVLQTLTRD